MKSNAYVRGEGEDSVISRVQLIITLSYKMESYSWNNSIDVWFDCTLRIVNFKAINSFYVVRGI